MIQHLKVFIFSSIVMVTASILFAFTNFQNSIAFKMPYKKAGLTERQAAAHLVDRLTFGNKPGAIDELLKTGLENWFIQQLEGKENDAVLAEKLSGYDALQYSNIRVATTFPRGANILKEAINEGFISKDSVGENGKKEYREEIKAYMEKKGYRPQQELFRQFINQKILSAAYSNNQLQQMLTEFWFNHFNVSITKNQCALFIPAYERDVIRPNASGKFGDLLLATAQSPAMLFYLDNFSSSGENEAYKNRQEQMQQRLEKDAAVAMEEDPNSPKAKQKEKIANNKKTQGLNENYAREIMELHTLGVDGGYTQQDVTQAARVLTGWTVYPLPNGPGNNIKKMIEKIGEENLAAKGFVHKGDFFFAINRHDINEKTILGKTYPAGGGYEEGVSLINMLAHHPSTAKFICKKLATKFVSDNPPAILVDKMAATFLAKNGDIKEILKTMVSSPEFWSKNALTQKTKSPFELAISAVRSLDADVKIPFALYQWINKMGQKLYYYQAPTGFPDKGQYWINTGSLLNRMNFGLAIASQKIPGVEFDLVKLNNNHEPESAVDALAKYTKIILPARNVDATIKRLTPLINDPSINQKIDEAVGKNAIEKDEKNSMQEQENTEAMMGNMQEDKNMGEEKLAKKIMRKGNRGKEVALATAPGNNSMLAQVVGIIIGSPEFQKK